MQQMPIGELAPHQKITQRAFGLAGTLMTAVKQDGDETRLDARVLDVFTIAKEGDGEFNQLLALLRSQDVW